MPYCNSVLQDLVEGGGGTKWRGGGEGFRGGGGVGIINGTLLFLRINNLSLLFLRNIN